MTYSTTLSKNGTITIPTKLQKKWGVKSGDTIVFKDENNRLKIEPLIL